MKSRRGFTLIELLIVIAIILILIAIALPNFLEAQIRARVTAVKADLRTVGIAMDTYFLDFDMYPPDHDPSTLTVGENGLFYLTSPLQYLTELPEDLFNSGSSGLTDAGDEVRWYEMGSTGVPWVIAQVAKPKINAYAVYSAGPDGNENFNDNDSWPYRGETPPCPTGMGYINYSPTNGTKSVGDLVQVGGEVTAGYYCVDHWRVVSGRRPN
ncbi:MAG: prepilin-type N-terminal cleavage/methylation domain-containing protein [Candidatus Omnitrophica bacterium]|nr:prepilin-type N-terminal cleavage/methylation domain-containing protein [Candidatus Omnitrophota bacterium]